MEDLKNCIPSGYYGKCQKDKYQGFVTFADFCATFLNTVLGSIKNTEESRISTVTPIEISMVAEDTPLPVNIDTFWASISNKAKLQALLRKYVIEHAEYVYPEVELVFSSAQSMSLPRQSPKEDCLLSLPDLDLTIEEADVWLAPHAIHATQTGAKRFVFLSSDTDVMSLARYF